MKTLRKGIACCLHILALWIWPWKTETCGRSGIVDGHLDIRWFYSDVEVTEQEAWLAQAAKVFQNLGLDDERKVGCAKRCLIQIDYDISQCPEEVAKAERAMWF